MRGFLFAVMSGVLLLPGPASAHEEDSAAVEELNWRLRKLERKLGDLELEKFEAEQRMKALERVAEELADKLKQMAADEQRRRLFE